MANSSGLEPHKAQIIAWYMESNFTEAMIIDGLKEQGLIIKYYTTSSLARCMLTLSSVKLIFTNVSMNGVSYLNHHLRSLVPPLNKSMSFVLQKLYVTTGT